MKKEISSIEIFRALSNEKRIGMVYALYEVGPLARGKLASYVGLCHRKNSGQIAYHIETLRNAGLIQSQHGIYSLTDLGITTCEYLLRLDQPSEV